MKKPYEAECSRADISRSTFTENHCSPLVRSLYRCGTSDVRGGSVKRKGSAPLFFSMNESNVICCRPPRIPHLTHSIALEEENNQLISRREKTFIRPGLVPNPLVDLKYSLYFLHLPHLIV